MGLRLIFLGLTAIIVKNVLANPDSNFHERIPSLRVIKPQGHYIAEKVKNDHYQKLIAIYDELSEKAKTKASESKFFFNGFTTFTKSMLQDLHREEDTFRLCVDANRDLFSTRRKTIKFSDVADMIYDQCLLHTDYLQNDSLESRISYCRDLKIDDDIVQLNMDFEEKKYLEGLENEIANDSCNSDKILKDYKENWQNEFSKIFPASKFSQGTSTDDLEHYIPHYSVTQHHHDHQLVHIYWG